jgi:hypothetical protein
MGKPRVRYSDELRDRVRRSRRSGLSIKQIAQQEGLSSSTVCLWVRDIVLSESQAAEIARRRTQQAGESYSRLMRQRRERWQIEAQEAWRRWRHDPLFLLGVGMYWGEGSKRTEKFAIANADPAFVAAWLRWCRAYAPDEQVRMDVNVHPDVMETDVHEFWTALAGPACRVKVIRVKPWKRHDGEAVRLPYGVATVFLSQGVQWHTKMLEWIRLAAVA